MKLRTYVGDLLLLAFNAISYLRGDFIIPSVHVVSVSPVVVEHHELLVNDVSDFFSVDLAVAGKAHVYQLLF